jgi:SAM-dependent methyltransferase
MIDDILYKLARKILGAGLYRALSRGPFGRARAYDSLQSFDNIFDHYRMRGLDFKTRSVLEVGAGNQFFTPLRFLSAGAKQVLVAEPVLSWDRFERDLELFNLHAGKPLDSGWARSRILAWKTTGDIPPGWNGRLDVICSHNVLEHFTDLSGYFMDIARLLSPQGMAYNKVDLSDHTYHIFSKYPFTRWILDRRMIHHFRYSRAAFDRLNDPKCYMNRILLPSYLDLARRNRLRIRDLVTESLDPVPIHPDLLQGQSGAKVGEIFVAGFGLTLSH